MGKAMEVITGFVTAPGATLTAFTLAAGNSLTIRSAKEGSMVHLLNAWVDAQATGVLRVFSPRIHDAQNAIRLQTVVSEVQPLLPMYFKQPLFPTDVLTAQLSGSAVAGDIETAALLVYYSDLPGADARFIDTAELNKRGVHIIAVENSLALGTAGGYSGEEAISAEFDIFKANTDYALVGYQVSVECAVVGWRGTDTGNLRVGGPGSETDKSITGSWFIRLSDFSGLPLIPVFNSNNRGSILLDGVQDENGTDTTVSSIFVQLA